MSAGTPQPRHSPFSALNRKLPLRDQIYEAIRSRILVGEWRPGDPVSEVEIARQLGVSRTPVREAVKRLSDEGLIDVFAQTGTFIAAISPAAVREAYIIRSALEIESVRRAAASMTPEHHEALEDIIAMHAIAISRRRFAEAIRLDDQFHRYIAEINKLPMLWRAVDISKAHMDRGRYMAVPQPGWGDMTISEHRAIVSALAAKKATLAAKAMREHLESSLRNILSLLATEAAQAGAPLA